MLKKVKKYEKERAEWGGKGDQWLLEKQQLVAELSAQRA